jgi:predicted transcriptional regulator
MSTRSEREAVAVELRSQGLGMREIAERMGCARSTVNDYLHDPGGHRLRARKDSYRGVCEQCGGVTNGSNGPDRAPRVCADCIEWTAESVVCAMQDWAEEHGYAPTTTDWRSTAPGHPAAHACVIRRLGWNQLLLRAGLPLACDRRPETQEWVEAQVRAGRPIVEIAADLDVTLNAIRQRLYIRGLSVSQLRAAA